jgi:hypothetical protein
VLVWLLLGRDGSELIGLDGDRAVDRVDGLNAQSVLDSSADRARYLSLGDDSSLTHVGNSRKRFRPRQRSPRPFHCLALLCASPSLLRPSLLGRQEGMRRRSRRSGRVIIGYLTTVESRRLSRVQMLPRSTNRRDVGCSVVIGQTLRDGIAVVKLSA